MILDLGQPSWRFDTEARLLLLTFTEQCPRDEPDPAGWRPSFDFRLELPLLGVVEKVEHKDRNEPVEIEQGPDAPVDDPKTPVELPVDPIPVDPPVVQDDALVLEEI